MKILVVEDDRDISGLITYNLGKAGFSVKQAFDGNQAGEILKDEHFDVVVLDIMLPGTDGFNICRMIKDDPGAFRTFIVIVSAKSSAEDKLYAHILGAHYYLNKPFSMAALKDAVKEIEGILEKQFTVSGG